MDPRFGGSPTASRQRIRQRLPSLLQTIIHTTVRQSSPWIHQSPTIARLQKRTIYTRERFHGYLDSWAVRFRLDLSR